MSDDVQTLFHLGAMGVWADGRLVAFLLNDRAEGDVAFRILLQRHGPMVLTVCRRVLGDAHAAEDAFQATFLVLVKKAGSIRDRDGLTGWLYGVALRVSKKAKARSARRRVVERQAADAGQSGRARAGEDHDRAELRAMIHEEVGRLPERYREPMRMCYLEGLRHHEIAERLECPVGTVESRLSRGRERLKSRLERRGVAPLAAGHGAMLLGWDGPSILPASLVESTVRYAWGWTSRRAVAKVAVASGGSMDRASAWSSPGFAIPGLVVCVGIIAGLGITSSRPIADVPPPPVADVPPPPTIIPEPEPEATPTPPARPSRADSAIARPIGRIAIDGRLDDWPSGLTRHSIARRLVGHANYDPGVEGAVVDDDPKAEFRVGYNREDGRIYLAVEVVDEDLVVSPADPWHTDAVEVYVDGLFTDRKVPDEKVAAANLPVIQYAGVPGSVAAYADPKGANPSLLYGKVGDSTTTMAYHRDGNITTYEWGIQAFDHYPDRPTALEPGKRIGLEVVVVDRDRDRKKPAWINWGPPLTGYKFLDAGSLGELILAEAP